MTSVTIRKENSGCYTLVYDKKTYTGFSSIRDVRDKIEEIEHGSKDFSGHEVAKEKQV